MGGLYVRLVKVDSLNGFARDIASKAVWRLCEPAIVPADPRLMERKGCSDCKEEGNDEANPRERI